MARMPEHKKNHFIETHCGALNPEYAEQACQQYEAFTQACRLLNAQAGEQFWNQCRCAFEVFYETLNRCNKAMSQQYDDFPLTDAEDIAFGDLLARLKTRTLQIGNLAAWRKYVRKMAYREIRRIMDKQGLLPSRKQCGFCRHIAPSKPYFCSKKEEVRHKTDDACEQYSPNVGRFMSLDADHGSYEVDERGKAEKLRSELRYDVTFEMLDAAIDHAQTDDAPDDHFRAEIERRLRERANNEAPGSKRRQICRRQYDVFVNLMALLADGIPKEQAEERLAKQFRLKDARTIRRDLEEIRAFLGKNVHDNASLSIAEVFCLTYSHEARHGKDQM